MYKIAQYRAGRIVMHLLALLVAINHFQAPRIGFAVAGIARELAKI